MSSFVMELHFEMPDDLPSEVKRNIVAGLDRSARQYVGKVANNHPGVNLVGSNLRGMSPEERDRAGAATATLELAIAEAQAPHSPADVIGKVRAAWATVDHAMQELSDDLDDLGRLADEIEVSLLSKHDDR